MPKNRPLILCLPVVLGLGACEPSLKKLPASEESLGVGAGVYEQYCAICHLDGGGNETNPSLIGSAMVMQPSPEGLLRIILHGSSSARGIMPKQDFLTDEEAAGVAAYVRKTFGKIDETVPAEVAKKVRAEK